MHAELLHGRAQPVGLQDDEAANLRDHHGRCQLDFAVRGQNAGDRRDKRRADRGQQLQRQLPAKLQAHDPPSRLTDVAGRGGHPRGNRVSELKLADGDPPAHRRVNAARKRLALFQRRFLQRAEAVDEHQIQRDDGGRQRRNDCADERMDGEQRDEVADRVHQREQDAEQVAGGNARRRRRIAGVQGIKRAPVRAAEGGVFRPHDAFVHRLLEVVLRF